MKRIIFLLIILSLIIFSCKKTGENNNIEETEDVDAVMDTEYGFSIIYEKGEMRPFNDGLLTEGYYFAGLKTDDFMRFFNIKTYPLDINSEMTMMSLKEAADRELSSAIEKNGETIELIETEISGKKAYSFSWQASSNADLNVYITESGNKRYVIELFRSYIGIEAINFTE